MKYSTEGCKHKFVYKAKNELGVWYDCKHCKTTILREK